MPAFDLTLLPPEPDLTFELALWKAGLLSVAGIDEAGRGALAGPVAAAAVILPLSFTSKGNPPFGVKATIFSISL